MWCVDSGPYAARLRVWEVGAGDGTGNFSVLDWDGTGIGVALCVT